MIPPDPNANPYAAPQAPHAYAQPYAHGPYAASPALYTYREGDALVHPLGTWLPAVCMKCGRPDGLVSRNQTFQYTPPWAMLGFVLCNLLGILLVLAVRKQTKMPVPLCQPCNDRWRRAMIAVWVGLGATFGVLLLAIGLSSVSSTASSILLAVFGLGLIGLIVMGFVLVRPALLRAKKIDPTHIWLLGVAPHVLEQLPSQWVGLR